MNSESLIKAQDKSIILLEDVSTIPATPLSRRTVIRRAGGGAVALASQMGIGGSLALLSTEASAITTFYSGFTFLENHFRPLPNSTYKKQFSIFKNGGIVLVQVYDTTPGAARSCVVRLPDGQMTFFNGCAGSLSNGLWTFACTNQVATVFNSDVFPTQRQAAEIPFNLPADARILDGGVQSLSNLSDTLTLFWQRFTSGGVYYFAATLKAGGNAWSPVLKISGADYNTFAMKRVAYTNAVTAYSTAQGRYRTSLIMGSCAAIAGIVGVGLTGGAATAILVGGIATLAGNNVLNGQALTDASAVVATTWIDLASWVESKTGFDLVR